MKAKHMLLPLLLAALLALSPCALAEAPAAAEFEGGEIAYADALAQYQSVQRSYADLGIEEDPAILAQQVLEGMVEDAVLQGKAGELGLLTPDAAALAALQADAEATHEALISYYIDFCASEGMTEGEARAATEAYLAEEGQSVQDLLDARLADWWRSALYEYICGDVAATEADIQAYYDALAQTQQLQFAEDPTYFDYLYMNDDLIAYRPEGMRYIKHIIIGFDEAMALTYESLVGEGRLSDADPEAVDALYAQLDDRVVEVLELLMQGEDFDALMRTHGDDENMRYEPYSTDGYIVREGSALFVPEFTEAAFSLQNIGDVSDPVRTAGGVHFILYAGDVPAGPVPPEEIWDALAVEAQNRMADEAYDAQVAAWVAEAAPVYHPEYLLQ